MNILIVDDQEKVLEATRRLVDWEKLKVKKVFTADSADAARYILDRKPIDIMLTDIEMPGEDGIELQRWVAGNYPGVICIFLTSHADFQYAKEAIRNGVFDYILQPASIPDIEDTIRRCILQLKERELAANRNDRYKTELVNVLESHVFSMFYRKKEFSHMKRWREDSDTQKDTWWYLPCLMEVWNIENKHVKEVLYQTLGKISANIDMELSCIASCLDTACIGVLIYAEGSVPGRSKIKEWLQFVQEQIRSEMNCELNLYLGNFAQDDLPVQIEQIFEFRSDRILERNEIYLVKEMESNKLHKPNGVVWGEWLIRGDISLVRNQITNLLIYAQSERLLTISYMRQMIHAFLEACTIACCRQNRKLSELFTDTVRYDQMIHAYPTVQELNEMVDFCLQKYRTMIPEGESEGGIYTVQDRIEEVIRYLDEHMDQMISRREAAKYVFLNEDYFSRLFLKKTGMRYKEYIIHRKMTYARELLVNTEFPVALVASKIGYENMSSFTKRFRKHTGIAPLEYRKQQRELLRSEKSRYRS